MRDAALDLLLAKQGQFPHTVVDLTKPPKQRWCLTQEQSAQAQKLLAAYKADLGASPDMAHMAISIGKEFVRPSHWNEMEGLAQSLNLPVSDVAICNFYYDAIKLLIGCTAFAVDTPQGPIHARNLDWHTENRMLDRCTIATRFLGAPAGEFTTIGWPGFVGVFSGIAPRRFAVTLNAVSSLEPAQPATPVVFLLRQALEEAHSFEQALDLLSKSPIPCDCLLLLTGVNPGEMVVIERTPTRHAIRTASDGFIAVANDYREMDAGPGESASDLLTTSCNRFDRAASLVRQQHPKDAAACFGYLTDSGIQMETTVQQMVFRAATGEHWLQSPAPE